MHPETPPEAPSSDASNLDILRSFAVLAVLADHVLETYGDRAGATFHPYDYYLGRIGVLFFFVHTSLVLMYSLARMSRNAERLFARFYIRRAFRIYPLSTAAVLASVLLQIPPLPWEPVGARGLSVIASNLALTMNLTYTSPILGPLWSLPLEVQMYLVLPLVFVCIRRGGLVVVAGCWVSAVLLAVILPVLSDRLSVAAFGPCFIAGAVAFVLEQRVRRTLRAGLWPLTIVGLGAIYVGIEEQQAMIHPMPLAWGICLALGQSIPHFRNLPKGTIQRLSHQIATYSYGIYLMHITALWIAFYVMEETPVAVQLATFAVLMVALPVACYHAIEKPMMDLGRRLSN